jgi:hypothetical protein
MHSFQIGAGVVQREAAMIAFTLFDVGVKLPCEVIKKITYLIIK